MNRTRQGAWLSLAALLCALVASSLAWACTQQAILTLTPAFASPGKAVKVTGVGFSPGAPVEIRWNGTSGAILGIAEGPDFSTEITVPRDARPDVFFVTGIQRNVRDAFGQVVPELGATTPLGVLKTAGSAANGVPTGAEASSNSRASASDLWSGYEKDGSSAADTLETADAGVVRSRALAGGGAILATAAFGTLTWMILFVRPRRASSAD